MISPATEWNSSHFAVSVVTFRAYHDRANMRTTLTPIVPAMPTANHTDLRPRGMFILSRNAIITSE